MAKLLDWYVRCVVVQHFVQQVSAVAQCSNIHAAKSQPRLGGRDKVLSGRNVKAAAITFDY